MFGNVRKILIVGEEKIQNLALMIKFCKVTTQSYKVFLSYPILLDIFTFLNIFYWDQSIAEIQRKFLF